VFGHARNVRERKRLRLDVFDYATTGAYFVTVGARDGSCLFGEVADEVVELSPIGEIVEQAAEGMATFHAGVDLDAFVVMPNHVHAIVAIDRRRRPPPLPAVVGAFKARASRRADRVLWQRGYHDRIVRDRHELAALREYIETNPLRWALDREHPRRRERPSGRAG
jgi:REP element-mobilizing transposase RayT